MSKESKANSDNRANQLNPNNPAFSASRGVTPPSVGAPPATTEGSGSGTSGVDTNAPAAEPEQKKE